MFLLLLMRDYGGIKLLVAACFLASPAPCFHWEESSDIDLLRFIQFYMRSLELISQSLTLNLCKSPLLTVYITAVEPRR